MNNSTPIRYISDASGAPKAIGPYSQVTLAQGLAFLAGQIPLNPETMTIVEGGIEAQTEQVMKNLAAVLTYIDSSFSKVVSTTIYLTDFAHFETVNGIYDRWLKGAKPARATVQVSALPKGSLIEISMISLYPSAFGQALRCEGE